MRTSPSQRIVKATKNGREYFALATPGALGLFEFDSLAEAGMVRVMGHGQENVYFEWTCDAGYKQVGLCKCL